MVVHRSSTADSDVQLTEELNDLMTKNLIKKTPKEVGGGGGGGGRPPPKTRGGRPGPGRAGWAAR
jgi:hypothetical protein